MGSRLPLISVVLCMAVLYSVCSCASDSNKNKSTVEYREIRTVEIDTAAMDPVQKVCFDIVSSIDEAAVDTSSKEPPKYWTNGILTQVGLSQVSLTNWAEGGAANVSLNALVDANANYAKDKMIFENRMKISYGFVQSFEEGTPFREQFSKSDDRIQLDSKWGWLLKDKLYLSALLNFRTQLSPTYSYDTSTDPHTRTVQSNFMAPGYLSLGIGVNYRPFNFMSFNISPATGNLVVVTEESLRETYGNELDEKVRAEFGAQIKMDINYAYKIFKISSSLTLFSNYLNHPENIQVYWDVDASLALTKVLTLTARTNLIYDDNIKIEDEFGVAAPRVQFKEIVSLGLTWTFGQYIKADE